MADPTLDNGELPNLQAAGKQIAGGPLVQAIELVTAVEGGAKTDLAKAIGDVAAAAAFMLLSGGVRKDVAAALSGVADGDVTVPIFDAQNRMHVNVGAALAASRNVDSVAATLSVDRLMNNLTAVTPTMAVIDHAVAGDNTLVAAQGAGNIILVHQVFLIASAAVTVRFESGAGGTALTGQMVLAGSGGFVLPFNPVGWFKTAPNALLNLELSGAVSVDGVLGYTVVT